MGKGSRTRVRPLRLTDLWSRQRTPIACTSNFFSDINVVVSTKCGSSHSSSFNFTVGALLDTVTPPGGIAGPAPDAVESVRFPPSLSPGRVLVSDASRYPTVNAPDFSSNSLLESSLFDPNNNSTLAAVGGSRPVAAADPPPFDVSALDRFNIGTDVRTSPNKRCSRNDNSPSRKRQRVSLSLKPLSTPAHQGVTRFTPLDLTPSTGATCPPSLVLPSTDPRFSPLSLVHANEHR